MHGTSGLHTRRSDMTVLLTALGWLHMDNDFSGQGKNLNTFFLLWVEISPLETSNIASYWNSRAITQMHLCKPVNSTLGRNKSWRLRHWPEIYPKVQIIKSISSLYAHTSTKWTNQLKSGWKRKKNKWDWGQESRRARGEPGRTRRTRETRE